MNDASYTVTVKVNSPRHGVYIIDDAFQIEMIKPGEFQVYFMSDAMGEDMMEPGETHDSFLEAFEQVLQFVKDSR